MPDTFARPGRDTGPGPDLGRPWVRSQAAADLEPGPAAGSARSPSAEVLGRSEPADLGDPADRAHRADPADPADRAPRLPHTPPLIDDVNLVTVTEHEYPPNGFEAPTSGSRLLAQVRRSWAVSRSRSTG
jgi:hypothetical protein